MKNLKKLPTKQLEKFSNIFTQLGLVLVLFVVYITLEHQTEEKTIETLGISNVVPTYIEPDQNIVFQKEEKVKPKAQKPKVFIPEEVVKGSDDLPETIIDTPKEEPVVLNPDDIVTVDIPEDNDPIVNDVPFIMIEDAPVFKGCEGLSKEENKRCFDKKMKQFVQRNFDAGLASELGLRAGKYKIQTQFLIDDKGNVVDIKIRAPHKKLEKETNDLIKKLPKFTPGKQRNRPVRVRYTLPIAFSVE
ncbi:energy transducer TonB [Polaribacter batillariae]|uniref:Energy transducer TonB n=1 Tax=Polaribacter batillariae TaxID=2808900 RepID=A0ABX7SSY6_9FLAO|nr:energy transducer TonB [Polaribacter batillariae]QTD36563.1 energy transducer TonB [Polaribacter batillariae]